VRFVNHTFNSDLALSASLQPFAGNAKDDFCEYPVERKLIGESLVKDRIARDADGMVWVPEAPGLGLEPDVDSILRFLVDVEIKVAREVLYRTPEVWREGALPPMLKRCSTRAWTEASKTKTLDPLRFHREKPVFFIRSHRGLHSAKKARHKRAVAVSRPSRLRSARELSAKARNRFAIGCGRRGEVRRAGCDCRVWAGNGVLSVR